MYSQHFKLYGTGIWDRVVDDGSYHSGQSHFPAETALMMMRMVRMIAPATRRKHFLFLSCLCGKKKFSGKTFKQYPA